MNVWRNFLRKLKSPATCSIKDMDDQVLKQLKVSYNHIENPKKRNCFLYCGLHPEDKDIEKSQLIDFWKAEGVRNRGGEMVGDGDQYGWRG